MDAVTNRLIYREPADSTHLSRFNILPGSRPKTEDRGRKQDTRLCCKHIRRACSGGRRRHGGGPRGVCYTLGALGSARQDGLCCPRPVCPLSQRQPLTGGPSQPWSPTQGLAGPSPSDPLSWLEVSTARSGAASLQPQARAASSLQRRGTHSRGQPALEPATGLSVSSDCHP